MNRRSINCLLICLSFNYGSVLYSLECFTSFFSLLFNVINAVFVCVGFFCFVNRWDRELFAWLNNMATKQFIRASSKRTIGQQQHRYLFICDWIFNLTCTSYSIYSHTQFESNICKQSQKKIPIVFIAMNWHFLSNSVSISILMWTMTISFFLKIPTLFIKKWTVLFSRKSST